MRERAVLLRQKTCGNNVNSWASRCIQDFRAFFDEAGDNTGPMTIEDKFFEAEVRSIV